MYWQLSRWKLALLPLRLTTPPNFGRQKDEPAEGRKLITAVPYLFGARLKGGDSFLSASNISPLLLRNQIIRISNWILMDRPVLSAYWTATRGEQFICGQPDCRWRGFKGCDYYCPTGSPYRHPHFLIWFFLLHLEEKKMLMFSGKALHPPTACHLELPMKTMAAYWFLLGLHRSISDLRKQVTHGEIYSSERGKSVICWFPLRLDGFLQQNPYRECCWSWSEKAWPVINVIALFLWVWSATIFVSSYSSKNNQILCVSPCFYGFLMLVIPMIIVMSPWGISRTIKHPVWLQNMFPLLSSAVWHNFPWRLKHNKFDPHL